MTNSTRSLAPYQKRCRTKCLLTPDCSNSLVRYSEGPRVDTLKGSRHANMKELRFDADDGVWRVAFAFDPKRKAILLVAGDKSGGSEKRFYRQLMAKADERFDGHLSRLKKERKN
jgi:hypothetical protein